MVDKSHKEIEIFPTCVPHDAAELDACSRAIRPFASAIHLDITDGIFAPSRTWPYRESGSFEKFDLSPAGELLAEVHLMVEKPRAIGIECAHAGAFRIIGHVEAFDDTEEAHGTLDAWKRAGAPEVGLAILMETPFELLEHHMLIVDFVHMMSIATIGKQGIPYDRRAPERIAEFHMRHPEVLISVDGGVSKENIAELVRAGARRLGVGSAISKAKDPADAYARLKHVAGEALV